MGRGAAPASPPGAVPVLGHFPAYARDPLGFMSGVARDHGPLAPIRLGPFPTLLITEPAAIEEVLVTNHRDFRKSRAAGRVRLAVGTGLLVSEGETWRARRRVVQPAFHHDLVSAWGDTMVDAATSSISSWRDGEVRDVGRDMDALTLSIVCRTLLDSQLEAGDIADVRQAGRRLRDFFDSRFNGLAFFVPDWLPTPGNRRMRAAVRALDRVVYRLIAARRAGGVGGDAISLLLAAGGPDGPGLADREVRDEVMTLFMAGHETSAVTLAWALYLLSRSAAARDELAREVHSVLGVRAVPTVADLPRLPFTEAIILETLRLYPPAYALSREALVPTAVLDRPLPKGGIALISVWATHRRADLFVRPADFEPGRWRDGLARQLPRGAYVPFAEGPRKCVGAAFAMQETRLVLATIARQWSVEVVDDAEIPPRPAVSLRPAAPIRLRVRRVAEADTATALR